MTTDPTTTPSTSHESLMDPATDAYQGGITTATPAYAGGLSDEAPLPVKQSALGIFNIKSMDSRGRTGLALFSASVVTFGIFVAMKMRDNKPSKR